MRTLRNPGRVHLDAGEVLLAAVLASRWDPAQLDRIEPLAARTSAREWRDALRWHGVAGVVARNHAAALLNLPPSLASTPRDLHRAHVPRALAQLKVLVDAAGALEKAGIRSVPLKGIFLSLALYDDITVRQSVDVDLLIDPGDFDPAFDALVSVGFEPAFAYDGSRALRELTIRSSHHLDFQTPSGLHCELHWRTDPSRDCALPRLDEIAGRLEPAQYGPLSTPVLPRDLLLSTVATHAARSRCRFWRWGYDVLELSEYGRDPSPQPTRHTSLSVQIMERQLGLPPCEMSAPRAVALLSRHGTLQRDARREPARQHSRDRIERRLLIFAGLCLLEGSAPDAARRVWSYLANYDPSRSLGRARLVSRMPLLAPWLKLSEALAPTRSQTAARSRSFVPARRLRRGLFVAGLVLSLPIASLWRRTALRLPEPTQNTDDGGRRDALAAAARDLSVAAQWLSARTPRPLNCLSLALAGRWLLRLLGHPGQIRIGVKIDSGGQLCSHAWLVSSGVTVTGGPLERGFTEIWRSPESYVG